MTNPLHDTLLALLDRHEVVYRLRHHPRSEFSQETASILGVSGKQVAKTVLGTDGSNPVLIVVPADQRVDWQRVSQVIGRPCQLADRQAAGRFTGLEDPVGLPPFGSLLECTTVVDPLLGAQETITFAAASLTDSVFMSWVDYLAVAKPLIQSVIAKDHHGESS